MMAAPAGRDTTLAIVLGASEWPRYPEFQPAPSFRQSLADIVDYLCDSDGLGLAEENVHEVVNSSRAAGTIMSDLHRFLRDRLAELRAAGTPALDLLFYYVGHGLLSPSGALHFAVRTTSLSDPYVTSIPVDSLCRLIRDSAGTLRSYVVLDCCFAAAAIKGFMSPAADVVRAQVAGGLPAFGTALLCAAGARKAAQAPAGSSHTMFSGALLSVLRGGGALAGDYLSLRDLSHLVRPVLVERHGDKAVLPQLHEPQQGAERVDEVPLFPNPARRRSAPRPEVRRGDWAHARGTDAYGTWASFAVPALAGPPLVQRLRWIPPGHFIMGSPKQEEGRYEDEGPEHLVTFREGFWLCETACTEELWLTVTRRVPDSRRGPQFPVTGVSWDDAQDFIARLNALCPGVALILPSEAQWEYACRAGTSTRYSFGNDINPKLACYASPGPVPVASLPPNRWGLFEMHGNVWEWCADVWRGGYEGAPTDGSVWDAGPAAANRVLRGGCREARSARSASRFCLAPESCLDSFGFRCARVQA